MSEKEESILSIINRIARQKLEQENKKYLKKYLEGTIAELKGKKKSVEYLIKRRDTNENKCVWLIGQRDLLEELIKILQDDYNSH